MPEATFHFPKGFLWGTATASHQVEGNNTNNNWYKWEQEGHITEGHKCGLACDWWGGRWKEDFDRAAETGQNAHRFSIEWSRIQPTEDTWDEHAIDFYRDMLIGLDKRKMTPFVTLHHFSDPLWLLEQGAWENDETPAKFERFTRKVVEAFKDYVNIWTTINEPNVYIYSAYMEESFPPGKNDNNAGFKVMQNMLRGHAMAYHAIHEIQPEARVGTTINYRGFWPARPNFPPDRWTANLLSNNFNDSFVNAIATGKLGFLFNRASLPEVKGTQDYVGVNYYSVDLVKFQPTQIKSLFHERHYPEDAEISPTGFIANIPGGMQDALRWANRYGKPIMVLENGVEDDQDKMRPAYTIEHIHQVWRAINNNIPIKGYFHWSLVDNFEWERGWTQRFGLWGLNPETQERIRRPSVDMYAEICKTNSISSAMVEKFAPQIKDKLFPM